MKRTSQKNIFTGILERLAALSHNCVRNCFIKEHGNPPVSDDNDYAHDNISFAMESEDISH